MSPTDIVDVPPGSPLLARGLVPVFALIVAGGAANALVGGTELLDIAVGVGMACVFVLPSLVWASLQAGRHVVFDAEGVTVTPWIGPRRRHAWRELHRVTFWWEPRGRRHVKLRFGGRSVDIASWSGEAFWESARRIEGLAASRGLAITYPRKGRVAWWDVRYQAWASRR